MRRLAFRVAYDGTKYAGFQRQPEMDTIEKHLFMAFQQAGVDLHDEFSQYGAAGRTDKGVHALAQTIAITVPDDFRLPLRAINAWLPQDILLWAQVPVDPAFHPRYQALYREYQYMLYASEDLDASTMAAAAAVFEGEHDFRWFAQNEKDRLTQRTVTSCRIVRDRMHYCVTVNAPGFLWNQVRKMVTAIVQAGSGVLSLDGLRMFLKSKPPHAQGFQPVSASGLILTDIGYDLRWTVDPYSVERLQTYWSDRRAQYYSLGAVSNLMVHASKTTRT